MKIMKNFYRFYFIFVLLIGLIMNVTALSLDSTQSIFSISSDSLSVLNINKIISSSQAITLNIAQNIKSLSLNANTELYSNHSLVRIILVDSNNNEYLIFESYPAINSNYVFSVNNYCEETCIMNSIKPKSFKIQIENAKITMKSINYLTADKNMYTTMSAEQLHESQIQYKINSINQNQDSWIAGITPISQLSYSQKKRFFSNLDYLPNLQGFEYYKGGVFTVHSNTNLQSFTKTDTNYTLPSSFDWRNVHGENWMTSVKSQEGCGSCWAFTDIGVTETMTNLYFNQHLNYDFSEQDLMSCAPYGGCGGGNPFGALNYFKDPGVTLESYFPYTASDQNCSFKKEKWQDNVVKIEDFDWIIPWPIHFKEEDVKAAIIQKGALVTGIIPMFHAMSLVGYNTSEEGKTIWIFKNSWGADWGDNGYAHMIIENLTDMDRPYFILTPETSFASNTIACVDKDDDSYCNWGISETKPNTCPSFCNQKKDCDDSNSSLWSFISDTNFNCEVAPVIDTTNPFVSLRAPYDGKIFYGPSTVVNFFCNASDNIKLSKIVLWGNWTTAGSVSGWHIIDTQIVNSRMATVSFTQIINNAGSFVWNCEVYDKSNNTNLLNSNLSFNIIDQRCSDGTLYNQCSATRPNYCNAGVLVNDCMRCGCSSGLTCVSGACKYLKAQPLPIRT